MADSTDTFVREVWWFGSEGKASGSASLAQAFGVVFIGSTSPPSLLMEHIVHEATHHEFTARLAVDKQLTNGDALAPSPFRKNPRPLTRVLHAAVVAARLVEVLRRCQQYLDADERAQVQKSLDRLTLDLESGMRSLTEHAHWTPVGERMFDRMREFQTRTLVA